MVTPSLLGYYILFLFQIKEMWKFYLVSRNITQSISQKSTVKLISEKSTFKPLKLTMVRLTFLFLLPLFIFVLLLLLQPYNTLTDNQTYMRLKTDGIHGLHHEFCIIYLNNCVIMDTSVFPAILQHKTVWKTSDLSLYLVVIRNMRSRAYIRSMGEV